MRNSYKFFAGLLCGYLLIAPFGVVAGNFRLAGLTVNDPEESAQWHLKNIKAEDAWEKTQGSNSIRVAVIDSGIDMSHPDLRDNIWVNQKEILGDELDNDGNGYVDDMNGWDFVDNDNVPEPNPDKEHSTIAIHHGTAVAGIIGAVGNNGFVGAGIAWKVKMMDLRAFNEKGESDTDMVGGAIDYAIDNHADIINMSFVGLGYVQSLDEKIKKAYDQGILIVAAAGNENGAAFGHNLNLGKSYPICFGDNALNNYVLGVAGIDQSDKKADFSNYGSDCVDISAPAKGIYSTFYQNDAYSAFQRYFGGVFNGTSMAAPQVAGAAVLIKAAHPNYGAKELIKVLLESSDNIDGVNADYIGQMGAGRLNVLRALQMPVVTVEPQTEARIKYAFAARAGDVPRIWLADGLGNNVGNFLAYPAAFRGGVNAAFDDIDGDGRIEVIAAAGSGGGPHVRIFDLQGKLKNQFFALDKKTRTGIMPAVGRDIYGNKRIFIFGKIGAAPEVDIYSSVGELIQSVSFKGKLKNATAFGVGDVMGDGKDYLIFAEKGMVRIFNLQGVLQKEFVAFKKYAGNLNLSLGDIDGDGKFEIITSKVVGDSAINIFDGMGRAVSSGKKAFANKNISAAIGAGDRNSDGKYEMLFAPNVKGVPLEARIFDGEFNYRLNFYPLGKKFTKPVNVYIITRR
jgi:hypothetical protein